MYSKGAELQALHTGDKEGGDGGPVDAREASDQQAILGTFPEAPGDLRASIEVDGQEPARQD